MTIKNSKFHTTPLMLTGSVILPMEMTLLPMKPIRGVSHGSILPKEILIRPKTSLNSTFAALLVSTKIRQMV